MYIKNLPKLLTVLAMLLTLIGCTVTGEPKPGNVAFVGDGYRTSNQAFQNAISVGEVDSFPGTSTFTYGGKLAPNFSDESFKEVLTLSLKNANFYGEDYTLDAKLIDSGDWSDWFELGIGDKSRNINIEYKLYKPGSQSAIYHDVIESDVTITNNNFFKPYNIVQRRAAELSYEQNIQKLIETIDKL